MSFTSEGRSRDWRYDRAQGVPQADDDAKSATDGADDVSEDGSRASVLERAFHVLEQVANGTRPLNLTEMSRAARLPLPTTYRLAKTLVELRALEKESGRYTLGPVWSEWSETTGPEHACTSN